MAASRITPTEKRWAGFLLLVVCALIGMAARNPPAHDSDVLPGLPEPEPYTLIALLAFFGGIIGILMICTSNLAEPDEEVIIDDEISPVINNEVLREILIAFNNDMPVMPAEASDVIPSIPERNNRLLENLCGEKIPLLSTDEMASLKTFITSIQDQTERNRMQQGLDDYVSYINNCRCYLSTKSMQDPGIDPITIEGNFIAEGQQEGDFCWIKTFHRENLKNYIDSCSHSNELATEPETGHALHDVAHINIYQGFHRGSTSFVNEVRPLLVALAAQQNQQQLSQVEGTRAAHNSYYARMFAPRNAPKETEMTTQTQLCYNQAFP